MRRPDLRWVHDAMPVAATVLLELLTIDIHCASYNSTQLSERALKAWLEATAPPGLDLGGDLWQHKTAQHPPQRAASRNPSPISFPGRDVLCVQCSMHACPCCGWSYA